MTSTLLATLESGHKIAGASHKAMQDLFASSQLMDRCPDDDYLRRTLAALPIHGIHEGIREDVCCPFHLRAIPGDFFASENMLGGLQLRIASSDTSNRYYWALGDEEIFGTRAEKPPTTTHIAMLINSIAHHMVALFFKEKLLHRDPSVKLVLNMPQWFIPNSYIRFCPLDEPLKDTPFGAGFERADDHNNLIVAYTIVNYEHLANDYMLHHLPEGQWRRTELRSFQDMCRPKQLSFQQALGYVFMLPNGALNDHGDTLSNTETQAIEQLIPRLKEQHELCQLQHMSQVSLFHDGQRFVMLVYERSAKTMLRFPPIDPVTQPVELIKMICMLTMSALIYTTDEEGDRTDQLYRKLHPNGSIVNGFS
ncbi:unnamed protein product [Sympodiomycopsis kandeliae]